MAQLNQLFRKEALEQMSSPEELDQRMRVTSVRGWLTLAGIGVLLVTAVLWSIFGYVPQKVHGQGILIKTGGVLEVVAAGAGQIQEISVRPGDVIQSGQVIARISQPTLTRQLNDTRARIFELQEQLRKTEAFTGEDLSLQQRINEQTRERLENAVSASEEQLRFLNMKRQNQEQLSREGLITQSALVSTIAQIEQSESDISQYRGQMQELAAKALQLDHQRDESLRQLRQQIDQQERSLADLRSRLEINGNVVSPFTGRVIDLLKSEGKIVNSGSPVLRLERIGKDVRDLEVVFYIPADKGKLVRGGMEVQVSPDTVKQEEYGVTLGRVTAVSEYPATSSGIMDVLSNDALVGQVTAEGSPIQIFADLIPSRQTYSGYRWSSGDGPESKLLTGTMCQVSVVIEKAPPITLVIPALKKFFGL